MRRAVAHWTLMGATMAFLIARSAASVFAIETTYGEDPVPDTRCYKGFLDLGYGIDPIPAKTLSQRWQEWRATRYASRWSVPRPAPAANSDHGNPTTADKPQARPSARRAQPTAATQR
jgi:hypothetical protein